MTDVFSEHISYSVSGRLAHIEIARPPVNALSLDLIKGVVQSFRRAAADEEVYAVILKSGVPDRFSAGLDIDILHGKSIEEIRPFLEALYVDLFDVQYTLGKPSIALVGGAARGGGMTMAISCDVILASESATFGYPEIDLGLLPAIHFAHLPKLIGRHRAFELLFSGRSFDADEACQLGLVSRVVPNGALEDAGTDLAGVFASKPRTAVQMGRAAFMRQNDLDYRRSIACAVEDFCNVATTADAQRGLEDFLHRKTSRS